MASQLSTIQTHNRHFGFASSFRHPQVNRDFDQLISFLISNPPTRQSRIGDPILQKEIERFRDKMHSLPGNNEPVLRHAALQAINGGISPQQIERIVVGRHISAEDLVIGGKKFHIRQVCYARPSRDSDRGYSPFKLDRDVVEARDGVVVWQFFSWKGRSISRDVIVPKEVYLQFWNKKTRKKTFYIPTSEATCRRGCGSIDFLKFTSWDWVKAHQPTT